LSAELIGGAEGVKNARHFSVLCYSFYNRINIRIVVAHRSDRMKIEKCKKNAENRRQNKISQRKRLNNANGNQWKGIKE
jgi:hypothetical protein